jgi:hypothetical protein
VTTTLVKGRGMGKSWRQETQAKVVIIHLKEYKMDKVVGGGDEFYYMYIYQGVRQRDVVYLGWQIAPSYKSPYAGGGGWRGLSQ